VENSIFLAKFLGPYCTIVAVGILFNLKNCQKTAEEYCNNAALVYFGGILALFFGLLILLFHNHWAFDWTVIITIFGCLGLIKGTWLIVFPNAVKKFAARYQKSTTPIKIQSIIILAVGIFLMLKGYCGL